MKMVERKVDIKVFIESIISEIWDIIESMKKYENIPGVTSNLIDLQNSIEFCKDLIKDTQMKDNDKIIFAKFQQAFARKVFRQMKETKEKLRKEFGTWFIKREELELA